MEQQLSATLPESTNATETPESLDDVVNWCQNTMKEKRKAMKRLHGDLKLVNMKIGRLEITGNDKLELVSLRKLKKDIKKAINVTAATLEKLDKLVTVEPSIKDTLTITHNGKSPWNPFVQLHKSCPKDCH